MAQERKKTIIKPEPTPTLLLRVPEAARTLAISRSQAYELIRRGVIPAIKLGDSVRVPRAELEAMVRRETQGGTSVAATLEKQGIWRN